jgi:pimeloyl-ACP methyl ester carboxylesterase/class 3 adenylate cyclase
MRMSRVTRYADSGGQSIAYQVIGDGPPTVMLVQGLMSHLDLQWYDPLYASFLNQLASFCRLIVMDQRGVGLSDASPSIPTIDERVADVRAVADAAGVDRMYLIGHCHGGPAAIVYAATYPERLEGLVLMSTFANGSPDAIHPAAATEEGYARWMEAVDHWGEGRSIEFFNPGRTAGRGYRTLFATFERSALSKGMARAAVESTRHIDVTAALGEVRVPTLVMHCTGDFMSVEAAKDIAASIPGAKFVKLDGADHAPFIGAGAQQIVGRIREFVLTSHPVGVTSTDRFGAVVMTDIIESTRAASEFGDARWAEMLSRHDVQVHDDIDRYHGECVKFTGDGYFAIFESCEDAVRCAAALRRTATRFGLAIRCGVHAGRYEPAGQDAIGLTVIIASRLMAAAAASKTLVSDAVVNSVAGAGFRFGANCSFDLKGIGCPVRAAELVADIGAERWLPDLNQDGGQRPTRVDKIITAAARRFPAAAHLAARTLARHT